MSCMSVRTFTPESPLCCFVDDFSTTTGLIVTADESDNGTYSVTWAAGDYELHPLDGLMNGEDWPYFRIEAVGDRYFPMGNQRAASVRVTARWGWAEIPAPVRLAGMILAASDERVRALVRGEGGFTRWSREHAVELLEDYRHPRYRWGIA